MGSQQTPVHKQIYKKCTLFCMLPAIYTIFKMKIWCIEEGMIGLYMLSIMFLKFQKIWSLLFAVILIKKTGQATGKQALHPEPGSKREKVS